MAEGAIRVRGLKELTRDFKAISKALDKRLTGELIKAAEPVKHDAEDLAMMRIRNMPSSPQWATMRIGVMQSKGLVYMVPASRGGRDRGKGLADLLLTRSMDPALAMNEDQIVERVDDLIGGLADRYGF